MNTKQFKVETGLEVKSCLTCGIIYAIPTELIKKRRGDHKSFYCPNGHSLYFPEMTDEERLSRSLELCQISCENQKRKSRFNDYKARYWRGRATKIQKVKEGEA